MINNSLPQRFYKILWFETSPLKVHIIYVAYNTSISSIKITKEKVNSQLWNFIGYPGDTLQKIQWTFGKKIEYEKASYILKSITQTLREH